MDRRRRDFKTINPSVLGVKKETKKETKPKKSAYQNHVENSVKRVVDKEDKPYERPSHIKINGVELESGRNRCRN